MRTDLRALYFLRKYREEHLDKLTVGEAEKLGQTIADLEERCEWPEDEPILKLDAL